MTSLTLTGVLIGLSRTAAAAPYRYYYRRDLNRATLGAQFEYGIWTGNGDVNLYGPGIGVRGGFTLDPGIYLGANFDYFFGQENSAAGLGASGSSRVNVYDFMGEIGYDFWVHPAGILRPKFGIGLGIAKSSACVDVGGASACNTHSENGLAIAPGLQYLHFFSSLYLSLEARYQTVSIDGPDPSAFILGVGLGFAF